MKAIKEFLKPNWWKVILTFVIVIFVFLVFPYNSLRYSCLIYVGCEGVPFCNPITVVSLSCVFLNVIGRLFGSYLLACLIYSIITKIKSLIAK